MQEEKKEKYIIDFDGGGFLALFIGIIILYVIVIFTIQVGVRVIQLAYLQIIAPIPIVMYLTPKGDDTLKKYMADDIHPNNDGYLWMGNIMAEYLKQKNK